MRVNKVIYKLHHITFREFALSTYKKSEVITYIRRYLLNSYENYGLFDVYYYGSEVYFNLFCAPPPAQFSKQQLLEAGIASEQDVLRACRSANVWLSRNGYVLFEREKKNGRVVGTVRTVIKKCDF